MEQAEGFIKIAASLIAIIVPSMLLAGYSYHLGYIMTFGLSEDLIFKSLSEVLVESWYMGITALGWLISKWQYLLTYILFLYLLFVLSFFWFRRQKEKGTSWLFEEITKENQGKVIFGISQWHWGVLAEAFQDLFSWFIYPVLALSFLGLLTTQPFVSGKTYALEQIELFQQKGCETKDKKLDCINLVDKSKEQGNLIAKGLLVSANGKRIAIYNQKLEVWPLLDNYLIEANLPFVKE